MARYKVWDKVSDIYTLGRDKETGRSRWSAQEYIHKFIPWAASPEAIVIVESGPINGGTVWEYYKATEHFKRLGANITDDMTVEQVLAAIEEFEDNPPYTPAPEERIAAQLEAQTMMALPVVNDDDPDEDMEQRGVFMASEVNIDDDVGKKLVLNNYTHGLWSAALVKQAYQRGAISREEYRQIIAQPRKGDRRA